MFGCASHQGRTILFLMEGVGEGWKIFTCKHYFCIWLLQQTIFLCVSVFLQKLFFSCIQFISVFTASANNACQHFPTHPPPPSKKMVRPLIILVLFSIERYISRKVLNAQARGLHLAVSNYSLWIIVHHGLACKGLDPSVIGNITSWCHHVGLGDWA